MSVFQKYTGKATICKPFLSIDSLSFDLLVTVHVGIKTSSDQSEKADTILASLILSRVAAAMMRLISMTAIGNKTNRSLSSSPAIETPLPRSKEIFDEGERSLPLSVYSRLSPLRWLSGSVLARQSFTRSLFYPTN